MAFSNLASSLSVHLPSYIIAKDNTVRNPQKISLHSFYNFFILTKIDFGKMTSSEILSTPLYYYSVNLGKLNFGLHVGSKSFFEEN